MFQRAHGPRASLNTDVRRNRTIANTLHAAIIANIYVVKKYFSLFLLVLRHLPYQQL